MSDLNRFRVNRRKFIGGAAAGVAATALAGHASQIFA
ncbi:MAG: twin-arginine translocation signal domain-containing protein, partial [Thermomicrobiales bacterium]